MKLNQIGILLEGISSILYHATDINSLRSIIKTDKFKLTPDVASTAETDIGSRGKVFFMSTTRHKLGGYSLSMRSGSTTIVLDGDKLGQRYSGKPVDYWGHDFRKIDPTKGEAEDRIYSSERFIENAHSYIKEVHIYADIENPDDRVYVIRLWRDTLIELKKQKIPYWIYDNKQAYLLQQKSKNIKIPKDALKIKDKERLKEPTGYIHRRRYLDRWLELYYKKSENELSKAARDLTRYLYSDFYKQDMLGSLSADMHNNKKNQNSGVDTIIDIMRKENIHDLKGFVDMIADKWTKTT